MSGKLYVFFGISGAGKDFMQKEFIKFSDGKVVDVPRIHSRKRRDTELDSKNSFDVPVEEICSSENFHAEVNGDYVGINKAFIKEQLSLGNSLAYSTGSTEMIEALISDPDISKDVCLIYIASQKMDDGDYFTLEGKRNSNRSLDEIAVSAYQRLINSNTVMEYYSNNQDVFDYAYFNTTKYVKPEIAAQFQKQFFDMFFKVLMDFDKETQSSIWISNSNPRRNINQTL